MAMHSKFLRRGGITMPMFTVGAWIVTGKPSPQAVTTFEHRKLYSTLCPGETMHWQW